MPKLIFSWQKKTCDFGASLLESFMVNFPENSRDSDLARALARHDKGFARHFPDPAKVKERDRLWTTGSRAERLALAGDEAFLRVLSEEQARDMLENPDPDLMREIGASLKRGKLFLSASPRLSVDTFIRLMIALAGTLDAETKEKPGEIEAAVRDRLADLGATSLVISDFPSNRQFEIFDKGYYPQKYLRNPSLGIMHESLKTSIRMLLWKYSRERQDILSSYRMRRRHGLTEPVLMEVDGEEYHLGLEELLLICGYCDLEEEGAYLVEPLHATGEPLIRKAIIWTSLLNREQCDSIWREGDIDACRELISHGFLFELTDSQAEDIIAVNDRGMAESLATRIHYLYRDWDSIRDRRLSETWRDKLRLYVEENEESEVRRLYEANGKAEKDD